MFAKLRRLNRLENGITHDVGASFGIRRRGRSSRGEASFWAAEKIRVRPCTFGSETIVIDLGSGVIRIVFS
jgi:hypothetical protein